MKQNGNKTLRKEIVMAKHLSPVRVIAAFLAGLVALIYFLIGFNVVRVIEFPADQSFGLYAGAAYLLGAALLVETDKRVYWVIGALLQVFVIYTYFSVAPERVPNYEVWGIVLRVLQVALLAALIYLSVRAPNGSRQGANRDIQSQAL